MHVKFQVRVTVKYFFLFLYCSLDCSPAFLDDKQLTQNKALRIINFKHSMEPS